jgi:hypothetical protein
MELNENLQQSMYPYNLEIDGARADQDQSWRISRIQLVLGYAQALADLDGNQDYFRKLKSIYDGKGTLFVTWNNEPAEKEKNYLKLAWESVVTDYEGNDIEHETEQI